MNVPSSSVVQVPIVTKKQYTLVDISEDGYVSMMDENMLEKILKLMTTCLIKLKTKCVIAKFY